MSLVGQLAWAARESLPHIAYDVSDLQQRFNVATVAELIRANSVLRTAKKLVKEIIGAKNKKAFSGDGQKRQPVTDGYIIMQDFILKNNMIIYPIQVL